MTKKILVMNSGSSTLKFELFVLSMPVTPDGLAGIARGLVDNVGGLASVVVEAEGGTWREKRPVADHYEASLIALDRLKSSGLLEQGELAAVGHRMIHGADRFRDPVIIDDEVIAVIESLQELAPLHNEPALQAIRAVGTIVGQSVPMVAVFDTAFHQTMPEHAWRYAIDPGLADKHRIRRYGFHGLAHRHMLERYCILARRQPGEVRLITLQLGNGCSATAITHGRSVDTSMGLTPLEGLIMGTRSGDVDPTLAGFLAEKEGTDVQTAEHWLNTRSGLLGVSGRSEDMRELLDAERNGDQRAALAIEMFCYRVKKYIGAYLAVLGGTEAIVFGGGIGENAPEVRARICRGMEWCGLGLDAGRNASTVGQEGMISSEDSRIKVYVIPVDEARIIARETVDLVYHNGTREARR